MYGPYCIAASERCCDAVNYCAALMTIPCMLYAQSTLRHTQQDTSRVSQYLPYPWRSFSKLLLVGPRNSGQPGSFDYDPITGLFCSILGQESREVLEGGAKTVHGTIWHTRAYTRACRQRGNTEIADVSVVLSVVLKHQRERRKAQGQDVAVIMCMSMYACVHACLRVCTGAGGNRETLILSLAAELR